MPNPIQRMLKQTQDAVPDQRPVRLPWQEPTLGERVAGGLDALADTASEGVRQSGVPKRPGRRGRRTRDAAATSAHTVLSTIAPDETTMPAGGQDAPIARLGPLSTVLQSSDEDASLAADRAATAAARAERASTQTLAASNQIAVLLSRLLGTQIREVVPTGTEEGASDIEIRVGEAAESPLARAADAVARAVAAAGETVYDYSEGHYGLAPKDAKELRREREKERGQARPVTIIEGHYAGEKQSRSRLPLLIAVLVVAAGLAGLAGFWFMQRRSQSSPAGTSPGRPARAPFAGGPLSATPAFDRVVRGELLPRPSVASAPGTAATSSVMRGGGAIVQTPPDVPATAAGGESGTRTFLAGESGGTDLTPDAESPQSRT